MKLDLERHELRLREPLATAFGVVERRPLLSVRLRARDGTVGIGEAAPLEAYDGVSIEAAQVELEACREVVRDFEPEDAETLLEECGRRCSLPQALAALDIAVWDLRGRRAARPVAELLVARPAREVVVNALIGGSEPQTAALQAEAALAAGFRCLKLKVATHEDDRRVAAVRGVAGRRVALRLDANGAWSLDEAIELLHTWSPFGIELCEEPVHGVEELRAVRRALAGRVAIAMDETSSQPGAIASGATDAVCVKLSACGGITGTLEAARRAQAAGSQVYLASTLDGPVGIAAALHAAAAIEGLLPCGLATGALFADAADPFPVRHGTIAVPVAPGLGTGASH